MSEKIKLKSNKRYGHCHENSLRLLKSIPNSVMLSGIINLDGRDIFHSVLEITKNNKKYIIDYNKNIIMYKDSYIKITYFKEYSRLTNEEFITQYEVLSSVFNNVSSRLYLAFKDEIMDNLNKNSKVLKLQD